MGGCVFLEDKDLYGSCSEEQAHGKGVGGLLSYQMGSLAPLALVFLSYRKGNCDLQGGGGSPRFYSCVGAGLAFTPATNHRESSEWAPSSRPSTLAQRLSRKPFPSLLFRTGTSFDVTSARPHSCPLALGGVLISSLRRWYHKQEAGSCGQAWAEGGQGQPSCQLSVSSRWPTLLGG